MAASKRRSPGRASRTSSETSSQGGGQGANHGTDSTDLRQGDDWAFLPERVAKLVRLDWRLIPQNLDKSTPVRWREFQEKSPTPAQLERWASDFPNCLWAVVTGRASGVIVLDFDVKDGGMETLRGLGLQPSILTPSGGAHVYVHAPDYRVAGGARLEPEQFPGMDLRADGQLATVYGVNRLVGGEYRKAKGARIYRISELPVDLRRLITDRRKAVQRGPVDLPEGFNDFAAGDPLVREALEMVASGGSRNAAGFHLACQLRDERHTFEAAEPYLYAFADAVAAMDHPYTRQEIYNSAVSAYSSPPREPRAMGRYLRGDGYALTDYGNAERFVDQHGGDVHYAPWLGGWFAFDGQRWTRDEQGLVQQLVKQTVRQIIRAASDVEDAEARQRLLQHARKSESNARLKAVEEVARDQPGIYIASDDLDSDPMLLNTPSGTVDLRTGELHPHSRADLITKMTGASYRPGAAASLWEAFLRRIVPDDEVREFLQRAIGYSLSGLTVEHVAFLLHGSGANGKSTFIETIRKVLGDYAQTAPADMFMVRRGNAVRDDIARLPGARFVTMSETEDGAQLAEALFKELTGGDRVTARHLYGRYFEFTPTAKFWLATNHRPEIKSNSEAIWRRMRLIPFDVFIPEDERDPRLASKLWMERDGILAWGLEGLAAWRRMGLAPPAAVLQATTEYRTDMDVIGEFIADRCEELPDAVVSKKDLYEEYKEWADDQGFKLPLTQTKFSRIIKERHGIADKKVQGARLFVGIGLRGRRMRLAEAT